MKKHFRFGALLLIGTMIFTLIVPKVSAVVLNRPSDRKPGLACPGVAEVVDADKFTNLSNWSWELTTNNPLPNAADLVFKGPHIYKDKNGIPKTTITTLFGSDGTVKHSVSVPEGDVIMKIGVFTDKSGNLVDCNKYYGGPVYSTARKQVDITKYKNAAYHQELHLQAEYATYGDEDANSAGKPNAGGDYAYVEAVFLDAGGKVVGEPIRDAAYNNGKGSASHESANPDAWMQFDQSVKIPADATTLEWHLVGVVHDAWNLDAYFKSATISANKKAFEVVFNDETIGETPGTTLSKTCVLVNEKPVAPSPQDKEGKTFIGWFDESGKKLTDADVVTKDVVYTARYEKTPKANTVQTIVGEQPTIEDYNKKITDSEGNPYPTGTTVTVTKIVTQPDVSTATGNETTTATITVRVEKEGEEPFEVDIPVPIIVTDLVIPQTDGGEERPDDVPADYVKVSVDPTGKGKLPTGEATVYWVTPVKEVTIPASSPTGQLVDTDYYAFTNWDSKLTNTFTKETKITANYRKIDDVIPHSGEGEERPDGVPVDYVRVYIETTEKGELPTDEPRSYWVNPKKEVTIPASVPTGKTIETVPHTFDKWSTPLTGTFTGETTITAEYSVPDLIPQTTPSKPGTVPSNYVPVTVNPTDKGELPAGEPVVYWVNPEKEVTIPASNPTGKTIETVPHTFDKWDGSLTGKFTVATEITAEYTVPELIPQTTPEKPSTVPADYVKVTLDSTEKGDLPDGTVTTYWAKPNTEVSLPEVSAVGKQIGADDFVFDKWDSSFTRTFTGDTTITAEYTEQDDVIPQEGDERPEGIPDDYVKITFVPTDKGDMPEGATSIYWVNPRTDVTIPVPDATGKTIDTVPYTFTGWDADLTGRFTEEKEIKATYKIPDVIPDIDGRKPSEVPENYVPIELDPTVYGDLPENVPTRFWVNPEVEVTIPAGTPTGKTVGEVPYTFEQWDGSLTGQFTDATTITAQYVAPPVIVQTGDKKPEGVPADYVKVTIDPTEKGSLPEGQKTVFWVDPKREVSLEVKDPTGKGGYTFTGWDKALKGTFDKETIIKAMYKKQEKPLSRKSAKGKMPATGTGGVELLSLMALGGTMLLRRRKQN